jgi:diguanylate cyclase (GGDEF)-like protein
MIVDILRQELERGSREGRIVAAIMADIDHFKEVNDTFGHPTGDRVLRQTADRLRASLRPYDQVGRYGGEEFLIVLAGCGVSAARGLAERLRRAVRRGADDESGNNVPITLSLGVAVGDGSVNADELISRADEALYRAKRQGRNRTVTAE